MPAVRWEIGGATLRLREVLIWGVALVLMLALHLFVNRTRLGKAMRATAQDAEAARMMGVDVDRVIITAFFLGSALAGAAALIFGLYYNYTSFIIGYTAGLRAFTAAVLGGIGSVTGAMVGGILIGLIESARRADRRGALDRRDHLLDPGAGAGLRRRPGCSAAPTPTKS